MALTRTEYMNLSTGTVRSGATAHGESLTDIESYLLPLEQVRATGLFGWGVASGLQASATPGQPGITVSTGAALDAAGHTVALAAGSSAVVDPNADPNQQQNITTVQVGADGLVLDTAGLTGTLLLTLTWREVLSADSPLALLHAPWLRLLPAGGFQDVGQQVVLAQATLDAAGAVTALVPGPRRAVSVPAGRLELRSPQAGPGLSVSQPPVAELRARPDGGLDVNLLSAAGVARPALSVQGLTGNLGINTAAPSAGLEIDRGATNDLALRLISSGPGWGSGLQLANSAAGARTYGLYAGSEGRWHFVDATDSVTRLVIDESGNVGIGIGGAQPARPLHVEGLEVHSGGGAGGYSFANRNTGDFVLDGGNGDRWVWYAVDGSARLWSGDDKLTISPTGEGSGLDVPRRMRVRQGGDSSAGIWFHQSGPDLDRAFVGMAGDSEVGFYGTGIGWGLKMNTDTGALAFAGDYGHPGGPSTLSLWDSRIGDVGNGTLFLRSGGNTVSFDGGDTVLVWGDLSVSGRLSKGGGGFRIDHPLDPTEKYLSHSFVESPEMLNLYNGVVTTDGDGEATIELPDYFAALNRDYCYQLTPIGDPVPAAVTREVRDNSFTIRTARPGVRVCWQVTGIRQDPWANANRIEIEEPKPAEQRNLFLHPEAHGHPAEKQVATMLRGEG